MKYKASIIIPCYNKENFIDRCIKSLINLSRFNEFEIIFIDDCSKDKTVRKIKKYCNKYENIKLYELEKRSGSPSKPRNIGIGKSSSKYLIFMDPDDEVINDGYSVLLTKMEEYQSDILIGTRIGVNKYGEQIFLDFIDPKYTYINENNYDIKFNLLNRPPFTLKTIYSKKLIIDNNIRFNEKISTSEDESFDMKCLAYAEKITKINDIVYKYTADAEGSITTNVSLKIYRELYDVMIELRNAYKLTFTDEVISERIARLIHIFYLKRLTFLKSSIDIEKACVEMYQAFFKYGFDNFDNLTNDKYIKLISDIKNKQFSEYINFYFINRLSEITNKYSLINKEKEKLKIENEKNKKILNRKIIKISIKIMKFIDILKKKILKKKIRKNKNK